MSAQIQIVGNVGRDPETKAAGQSGLVEFSVAVYEGKDKDGNNKPSTWYRVACWPEWLQAKVLDSVRKGMSVAVMGRLSVRQYTKKDGTLGVSHDISATEVLVPRQPRGDADEGHVFSDNLKDEDIPF